MGVTPMMSNSSFDNTNLSKALPNPDPSNYEIIEFLHINENLIINIKYHDCVNYEGNKILVFENCNIITLKKQRRIDPHFSENKNYQSPVARFEPTKRGWKLASYVAKIL